VKGNTLRAIECFRRALAVSPHNAEVREIVHFCLNVAGMTEGDVHVFFSTIPRIPGKVRKFYQV